jgi:hypothetical protein
MVRHYCESPIVRTSGHDGLGRTTFTETAGPTLCGQTLSYSGFGWATATGQHHEHGGISSLPKVNLLQHNLCNACVRHYLSTRPHLAGAVNAIKRARVESE